MSDPIDLDTRRPRPPLRDRSEWAGALWVTVGSLEWVAHNAIEMGAPDVARKALELADQVYDLAAELSE